MCPYLIGPREASNAVNFLSFLNLSTCQLAIGLVQSEANIALS